MKRNNVFSCLLFVMLVAARTVVFAQDFTGVEQAAEQETAGAVHTAPAIAKPAAAVYVIGAGVQREIRDALGVYMLDALVGSGFYRTIERGETFLSAVEQEHVRQRSGDIDDDQIRAIGKQSGVQYICVANISVTMGQAQISARIIDVETAEVAASGVSSGPLKTLDDLKQISAAVAYRMLGVRVQVDKNFELMTSDEQAALERMIAQTMQQQSWRNKATFWVGIGFEAVGLGLITYGIIENSNMSSHNSKHNYKKANAAQDRRNIAYGVGAAALLTGVSIHIFF